jgi:hypothetical protein
MGAEAVALEQSGGWLQGRSSPLTDAVPAAVWA